MCIFLKLLNCYIIKGYFHPLGWQVWQFSQKNDNILWKLEIFAHEFLCPHLLWKSKAYTYECIFVCMRYLRLNVPVRLTNNSYENLIVCWLHMQQFKRDEFDWNNESQKFQRVSTLLSLRNVKFSYLYSIFKSPWQLANIHHCVTKNRYIEMWQKLFQPMHMQNIKYQNYMA